jgi:hypothetical protein
MTAISVLESLLEALGIMAVLFSPGLATSVSWTTTTTPAHFVFCHSLIFSMFS